MNKVTIKACFKNNIVNLGKSIASYEQLQQEVKKRYFQNQKQDSNMTVKLYFQGQEITDLQALLSKAQQQKKNSVKIDVTTVLAQQKEKQNQGINSQSLVQLSTSYIQSSIKEDEYKDNPVMSSNEKLSLQNSFSSQKNQQVSQIKPKSTGKYEYNQHEQYQSDNQIIDTLKDESEHHKSKKYYFMDNNQSQQIQLVIDSQNKNQMPQIQRYQCYECNQQSECSQSKNHCNICNGTGYLDQNHKLVKFIEKILNKKLEIIIQKLKIQPSKFIQDKEQLNQLNEDQTQNKKIFFQEKVLNKQMNPDDIKIKVKYGEEKLVKKQGEQITWQFEVTNIGKQQIPQNVYVRDMKTYKIIGIQGLKINQSKVIKVGPFQNFQTGIANVQMFQIFYKVSSQVRYPIGQKFGFVCELLKQSDRKIINSTLFSKINKLKEFSQCEKSSQNIIMRLKELGIDEKNIQDFSQQDLIDIIQSCK